MDMSVLEKFNNMFDLSGLQEDIERAGKREYVEVPEGDYEVVIDKLELGESKSNLPQAKVWFKIIAGDFKGQRLFMYQNLDKGFQIRQFNNFLASLDSELGIVFEDFVQYASLMESIHEEIQTYEYQLSYGVNEKGFKTYDIVQKFN